MALVFPRREAEAQAFLDANPDIESVHVVWTDLCGVARGKVLRRDEVVPGLEGRPLHADLGAGARRDGAGRARNRPRLRRGRPRHADVAGARHHGARALGMEPTAQYIAAVHDLDGTPHYADPRNALEKIVKRFETELNMTPVGAVELEFFLMDRASATGRQADGAEVPDQRGAAAALPGLLSSGHGGFRALLQGPLCHVRDPGPARQDADLGICAGPDGDRAPPPRRRARRPATRASC